MAASRVRTYNRCTHEQLTLPPTLYRRALHRCLAGLQTSEFEQERRERIGPVHVDDDHPTVLAQMERTGCYEPVAEWAREARSHPLTRPANAQRTF